MNNRSFMRDIIIVVIFLMTFTGCGSLGKKMKAFLGGKPSPSAKPAQVSKKSNRVKFSDSPNYLRGPRRQYKRVTKKTLEDESLLNSGSGSLWVMEGQGAYLFSQNVVRMIGDPVPVRIEGDSKDQLDTKAGVIRSLLDRLDQRAKARAKLRNRSLASQKPDQKADADKKKEDDENNQAKNEQNSSGNKKSSFNVKNVTTRVIERTVDGNYRVKGSQPFMIGTREYKVIVTGIVRAEDFNEEGISSKNLLDPNFDIVGVRRKEM